MHPLPPAANDLIAGIDSPWLPPISFGVKPYLKLCSSIHLSLKDLEARYPSQRQLLSIEARQKRIKHKPK
jgi:hypothetical protein